MTAEAEPLVEWPYGIDTPEAEERVRTAKVLCVGAGGIGCELLKTLVMTGFTDIEVIDLDTIETSNLNRQFLFRRRHVGQPKAEVAASAVAALRPGAAVRPHHGNVVTGAAFGPAFFGRFDVVLNGLDNLEARRHVNRLCMAAGVPLVESGTAGMLGQAAPHVRGATECFECRPRPPPKTYAVCTVRNTPDKPIHCVVWAKDIIFRRIAGPPDEDDAAGAANGEVDDDGVPRPADEAAFFARRGGEAPAAYAERVFRRAFGADVAAVAAVAPLWERLGRPPPAPLDLDALAAAPDFPGLAAAAAAGAAAGDAGVARALGLADPHAAWTAPQAAAVFLAAVAALLEHRAADVGALAFDKDDALAAELVAAAANLRGRSYGIAPQSLFDARGMAGAIVHAVATTNAAVAGLIVLEALKQLTRNAAAARAVYLRADADARLLTPVAPEAPRPGCPACGAPRLELEADTRALTLRALVGRVLRGRLGLAEDVELEFGPAGAGFLFSADDADDDPAAAARFLDAPLAALPAGGLGDGAVATVRGDGAEGLLVVRHRGAEGWPPGAPPEDRWRLAGELPRPPPPADDAAAGGAAAAAAAAPEADGDGVVELLDDDDDDDDEPAEAPPRNGKRAAAAAGGEPPAKRAR